MNIELKMIDDESRIKVFKALADQTRIEIIRTLYFQKKELSCGQIGEECEASKSNASYHFRTLREAGLITVRKEAQTKYMSLNMDMFKRVIPGFLDTL